MKRQTFLYAIAVLLYCAQSLRAQTADTPGDAAPPRGSLAVASDFAGGSARVERIDQRKRLVRILPAAHKDRGWVCWWYLKISGITPGETISVDVGDAPWATPDRAAFSIDNVRWQQTAAGQRTGRRIVYRQKVDASEAWFAWGPPFVPAHAQHLVDWAARKSSHGTAFELCRTRGGRPVPALRIKQAGVADSQRVGIWVNARQHAWEAGSSWVCRGLVEWLLSDDARAESLRKKSLITIVPIMDIDNAALGAGGKTQRPHDHNRDWSEKPHWPSVAAAQRYIKKLDADGRFHMYVDLHNPGAGSRNPFFFVTPRKLLGDTGRSNLDRFLDICKLEMTGPLAFRGDLRESGANYDRQWERIGKNWVSFHTRDHVVSVTLETAWNTPHSTTDGYRAVGRQLALSMERYFRSPPRSAE